MRFTLSNTSGINTKFDFSFDKYEPHQFSDEKSKKKEVRASITMRTSTTSNISRDSVS